MKAVRAAIIAATLGACTIMPPRYDSIEAILSHPQNYEGCAINVRGDPEVVGRTMPGDGKMRLIIHITEDGKTLQYEETFERQVADMLVREFSGPRKWAFKGTYSGNLLYATMAQRHDKGILLPQGEYFRPQGL